MFLFLYMGKWTFVLDILRQSHTTTIHFLLGLCLWKMLTKNEIWTYQNQGVVGWVVKLQHLRKFLRECLYWRGGDIEFSFEWGHKTVIKNSKAKEYKKMALRDTKWYEETEIWGDYLSLVHTGNDKNYENIS